jgi:ERCC4-type nuclease
MATATRIIIDTREQTPWTFDGIAGIATERRKLESGDYSVAGLETRVAIERKSLDDWIGTVLHHRRRFYRELDRLRSYDFRAVVIEASVRDFHAKRVTDRVAANSLLGFVAEVTVAQSVPVYLAGTRAEAQLMAGTLLKMAAKKYRTPSDSE